MTLLGSGFSADKHPFSSAALNGHLYLSNDWDKMQRWDRIESTLRQAGVARPPQNWAPVPATAPGVTTPGQHFVRYRYRSSKTGYVSNPSNLVTLVVAAGAESQTFTIAAAGVANIIRSTDAKVDQIVLEASAVDGDKMFEVAIVDQTVATVVYNLDDATLVGKVLQYAEFGHDEPPFVEAIVAHKGRLVGAGKVVHVDGTVSVTNGSATVNGTGTDWKAGIVDRFIVVGSDTRHYKVSAFVSATQLTLAETYAGATAAGLAYKMFSFAYNVLFESLPLFPESWPPLRFTKALVTTLDRIRGLMAYHGDLLVMGQHSMERWGYTESIVGDGQPAFVPGNRGVLSQRCVIEIDGIVYGFDRQGFWRWSGGSQQHISQAIDPLLDNVNWAQDQRFHGVEVPRERIIRWYYAKGTDTLPKDWFEYDIDREQWATGSHEAMEITASATVSTGGERRAMVADSKGFTWFVLGPTDGSDPATTLVGAVAAAPAPTASVFSITGGGLKATGLALRGVPIHWRQGNQTRLCLSNTATQVTLETGFLSAPAVGDTIYVGRIKARLRTKSVTLSKLKDRFQERYLHLYFEPSPVQKNLIVRVYEDFGAGPQQMALTVANITRGVSITAGSGDVVVDLSTPDGYAKVPLGLDWQRSIEAEFEMQEPHSRLQLLHWEIDGAYDETERL